MRTNMRVAGIIFQNEKLVTAQHKKNEVVYYVLPGGGVEDYESIEDAIRRELKEELNINIITFRLVYIRELNIKKKGRGIEFYFYIEDYSGEIKKGCDPEEKESKFEDIHLVNLSELKDIIFYPEQLIDIIKSDRKENFNIVKHLGLHDYS